MRTLGPPCPPSPSCSAVHGCQWLWECVSPAGVLVCRQIEGLEPTERKFFRFLRKPGSWVQGFSSAWLQVGAGKAAKEWTRRTQVSDTWASPDWGHRSRAGSVTEHFLPRKIRLSRLMYWNMPENSSSFVSDHVEKRQAEKELEKWIYLGNKQLSVHNGAVWTLEIKRTSITAFWRIRIRREHCNSPTLSEAVTIDWLPRSASQSQLRK